MTANDSTQSREPLNVFSMLALMLDQAASMAWQKLGLQHDPITGTMDKDIVQARAAIAACESLAKILEPQLDEEDRRQMANLLRDLKVNFVEQSK